MQTWHFSVTEYRPGKPWEVLSVRSGMTVDLDDECPFWDWAYEQFPTPTYKVELDAHETIRHLRIVR